MSEIPRRNTTASSTINTRNDAFVIIAFTYQVKRLVHRDPYRTLHCDILDYFESPRDLVNVEQVRDSEQFHQSEIFREIDSKFPGRSRKTVLQQKSTRPDFSWHKYLQDFLLLLLQEALRWLFSRRFWQAIHTKYANGSIFFCIIFFTKRKLQRCPDRFVATYRSPNNTNPCPD